MTTADGHECHTRFAQGFMMTLNLPDTVEGLVAWCGDDPASAGTPVDNVLTFGDYPDDTWTAPPGVGAGDVIFFHFAARARALVTRLRRAAAREGLLTDGLTDFLDYAGDVAEQYAGCIFAVGILSGPAQPSLNEANRDAHWRSRLYAPLESVFILDVPLELRAHEDVPPRPHKAITELTAASFGALKERLTTVGNTLPEEIASALPGRDDFAGISPSTWRDITCRPSQRFAHETDVRGYFADYLLEELKDPGTTVYREARCVAAVAPQIARRGRPSADYLISLGGHWIPVETKRSLWSWPDLLEQVAQYVGVHGYDVRTSDTGRLQLQATEQSTCFVIDQDGLYVVQDGRYVQSGPGPPALYTKYTGAPRGPGATPAPPGTAGAVGASRRPTEVFSPRLFSHEKIITRRHDFSLYDAAQGQDGRYHDYSDLEPFHEEVLAEQVAAARRP